jgi:uncharacterized protein YjbJ (UPF0337 family)
MTRHQFGGQLKQLKGKAREQWGKLTDDQTKVVAGKLEQLLGRVQEQCGITKGEAGKQILLWLRRQPRPFDPG